MDKRTEQLLVGESCELAEKWQRRASELVSRFDRRFYVKMNKMLEHPEDKALLVELMDQCFRSKSTARVADQIVYLLNKHGMAHFFSSSDKLLLNLFQSLGVLAPSISVPLFVRQIRNDSRTVVINGDHRNFDKHLIKRKSDGIRNIANLIGEVVLGEEEASARLDKYLTALANPHIDYLSIKLSTLYSQMNSLNLEGTVEVLVFRLSQLFRQAVRYPVHSESSVDTAKFINLDMEEYRDLEITVKVFMEALDQPEFHSVSAGIAIQAYLPDSYNWQQKITKWAIERVQSGGAPVKIRLVKGANMEMEMTEADLRGWDLVTFDQKLDTDANYKRMVEYALVPEHARAVHLGVASHNLFELAYAVCVAKHHQTSTFLTIEMLEGMSESARRAIHEISQPVLLYAPTAAREQFTNAIAYLVRRLDENTGDKNFIRYSFGLTVGSDDWEYQKRLFQESFKRKDFVENDPRRQQNRLEPHPVAAGRKTIDGKYLSEADTDFTLPLNRIWAEKIRKVWKFNKKSEPLEVPVVWGGKEFFDDREIKRVYDRSQIPNEITISLCRVATKEDIDNAVEAAVRDSDNWRMLSLTDRCRKLRDTAQIVRERRNRLVGVAAAELGKVFNETDVEVSEAIDFLEFYSSANEYFDTFSNVELTGRGVGVVVPPWNFPIAIPLGGVAAALAAGNTVILKPASIAVTCAYELCKCFWDAGISKSVLQLLPCPGSLAGEHLIQNPDVDFVILTGGEDTAYQMLKSRPDLFLTAETGGKDATIVTAMADREQSIRNVCHSAFSNSGQKCSATSLLVLEKEVFEDESYKNALIDAARSMPVGSPWEFGNKISLLANEVSGPLKKALETLDDEEFWVLKPEFVPGNQFLLKPGVKWNVKSGSFCHMTELFGPLLSVMCAEDLEHAIEIVNATGYGLTSGLESLDEREICLWKSKIKAGNLYVNRGTTGAIVLRQPFGGLGKSAIGAGRKVGTYNYITQFMNIKDLFHPEFLCDKSDVREIIETIGLCFNLLNEDLSDDIIYAARSYRYWFENEFSKIRDVFKLRGEDNEFRYLPLSKVLIRVQKEDDINKLWLRVLGAEISGTRYDLVFDQPCSMYTAFSDKRLKLKHADSVCIKSDEFILENLGIYDRVLYADIDRIPLFVHEAASKETVFIVRHHAVKEGRLELLHYFNEQSITHSYHRYGNLGARGGEF